MDRLVIKNYLDDPEVELATAMAALEFTLSGRHEQQYDRYDNPFERKWTLKKDQLSNSRLQYLLRDLAYHTTCWWVSRLLDVPIDHGDVRHYGGVFIYSTNDYLKPHVDAGRHPTNGQTKVATACLYLTPATLYFYRGDVAWFDKPLINHIDQVLHVPANSLVLFTNHDTQWHEVPIITTKEPRVCITVSYLAPPDFKDPRFMNKRTRAYFARHMSLPDTPELAELRERRASEEHHASVYRVEGS